MASILDLPRSSPTRNPRRILLVAIGFIVAVFALVVPIQRLTPTPSFVDRLTVVNPTAYHLEIDVIGADRSHGINLGSVGREQTTSIEDVIDQGREWIFRFASGGTDGGEARITRDQLRQEGWRFTVPADVAQQLQAAGLSQSPHPHRAGQ